jgi:hypothetical protein
MSGVRHVHLTGHDLEKLVNNDDGQYAIVPWEEWEHLAAEREKYQWYQKNRTLSPGTSFVSWTVR